MAPGLALLATTLVALTFAPSIARGADECPQPRQVRADVEAWKRELSKKGLAQAKVVELFDRLKLKTGFARELPDIEKSNQTQRTIEVDTVEDYKVKLTGAARPETVVQVKYTLKLGKACGDHEDHCFEGYAIQVLKPISRGLWCSLGTDLSVEVWGPDREVTFCPEARSPAREFSFFALVAQGRKAIKVDDFRAHCPSNGNRSRSQVRSFWEVQNEGLVEIFRATLHSEAGGPDHGKLTTLRGRLAFSGDFPKLVHYEVSEENCGPEIFTSSPKPRSSCPRAERFQVFQYRDGRYSPEAPTQ